MMRIWMVLLLLLMLPSDALAYECWAAREAREELRDADAVFVGEVVQIEEMEPSDQELNTPRKNILFSIIQAWKGIEDMSEDLYVDTEAFYQYEFEVGKRYLVFAYQLYGERLSIVGCPRVRLAEAMSEDIRRLGDPLLSILRGEHFEVIDGQFEDNGDSEEEKEVTLEGMEKEWEKQTGEKISDPSMPPPPPPGTDTSKGAVDKNLVEETEVDGDIPPPPPSSSGN